VKNNDKGITLADEHYPVAPATLLDVARRAGVSASTVSRILNGTAKVADAKRQKVLEAIKALNFTPNQLAQNLKSGNSMTIGIVVQDISSPFFDEALRGVDEGLKGTGYTSVIVSGHWNAEEEEERIRLLLARKVDGIILLSGRLSDEAVLGFSRARPIVSTGRNLHTTSAIGFKIDNEYGAFLAVQHLIQLGHRRIAFVAGPADHADAADRLKGYERALTEARIDIDQNLIVAGNFHEVSGLTAVSWLLEKGSPFTAIFAANDLSAYGVRLGLYRKGIRVPEDISLVGFDDLPGSAFTAPPLTTIRQPIYEMGRIAIHALLDHIEGKPAHWEVPPVELVVRETTRKC